MFLLGEERRGLTLQQGRKKHLAKRRKILVHFRINKFGNNVGSAQNEEKIFAI